MILNNFKKVLTTYHANIFSNTNIINKNFVETLLVLLIAVLWNQGVYYGARFTAQTWHHYDMTTSYDLLIPVLPWTITIYFGCYIFWGINYYLCAVQDKLERDRFFCADAISKFTCLLFFLFLPTTNIRPEISDSNLWNNLINVLYQIDSADNLFPSIHCLVSWLCWIGVRKRDNIPALYRNLSLFLAILVCLSTLTTKQHVIFDVIGGILIAELCYSLSAISRIRVIYSNIISYLLCFFKN